MALATWQFIFLSRLISNPDYLKNFEDSQRYLRMVHYENVTLILSLVAGGVGLFVLLRRERQKSQTQQEFFATFTHEIKTSLAAIKLRAEALQGPKAKELTPWYREELLKDLNKLEVQLENSLFLARGTQDGLFTERLSLKDVLMGMGSQTDLQIHLQKNCWINADRRALESILKNILMNSTLHGKADNIWIEPQAGVSNVKITFRDDGQGLAKQDSRLGELFFRPESSSGNGIGLYLLKNLSQRMGGDASFSAAEPRGFTVIIELPGSLHG